MSKFHIVTISEHLTCPGAIHIMPVLSSETDPVPRPTTNRGSLIYSAGRNIGNTWMSEERADECGATRHLDELRGNAIGLAFALLHASAWSPWPRPRAACTGENSTCRPPRSGARPPSCGWFPGFRDRVSVRLASWRNGIPHNQQLSSNLLTYE